MKIKGLWSSGIFYYDTFEDSFVGFIENNLGFFYYMNVYYDDIELFKWNQVDTDTINIEGIVRYIFEDEVFKEINKNTSKILNNIIIRQYKKVTFNKEIDILEFSKPVMLEDKEFGLNEKDILNSNVYKRAIKLIGQRLPKEFQIVPQNY